jgi:hypothetical protein
MGGVQPKVPSSYQYLLLHHYLNLHWMSWHISLVTVITLCQITMRHVPHDFACDTAHRIRYWVELEHHRVGGERTTSARTASTLNLRRANARRPLTH